jgi:CzcA family heavy metal efflux pump
MTMPERRTLMRSIVSTSLRFRVLVVAFAVGMMVFGVATIPQMRVDVFPEFAPPQVEIQTTCVGLSTSDVESLVTVPLEQALNGVKGLDDLRSKSVPQLSSIQLIFKPGVDLLEARQLVQERLAIVAPSLPTWAAPPSMLPPLSATSRALQIGMTWKDHSAIAMSKAAFWTIRARLLRIPGVANVSIWGERLQQMQVQVDPAKMAARNVSLESVMGATADSVDSGLLRFNSGTVIGTGGAIETATQRIGLRRILPIVTPADLAKVSIANNGGTPMLIGDVANVVEGSQPLIGDAVINSSPGLLLVVQKLPWANALALTHEVEQVVATLQQGMPGVQFNTKIFQQARFIDTAIHNLRQALVFGFVLVMVILFLFLFEWRVALISLITIPMSLMATILVLYWRGETINTMTLAGLVIALGALVDDAIIDIENIMRRLRQHRREGTERSTASIILEASLEVRSPIVYATLIIVAAAIPIFLLAGLTGAFFRPLALSYTLAILASMVVAITVTPALALILLRRSRVERHESPLVPRLQRGYTRMLSRIVPRPRMAYATFVVVTLAGLMVLPSLGQSLFPTFKERDFLIHWIGMPGTSAQETQRTTIGISKALLAVPGVRSFGSHIGQALQGEEVAGVNFGEMWISVDDSANLDSTLKDIRVVLSEYPGIYHDTLTYLNERIEEVLTGAKEPIVVRLYGPDLTTLRTKANEVLKVMSGVGGIADSHVDLQVDVPQIEVKVNLAKAARYGLKPGDVRRAAATLVAGEEVGDIFRGGRIYGVIVWSTPTTRSNVTSISNLPIDTPSGVRVHVGDVASVRLTPIPNVIERQSDSRRIDVVASVRGRDLSSVVTDLNKGLAGVSYPVGFHAELLGEYKELQSAQSRLIAAGVLAAVVIFLLLQAAFGSWRLATFVFLTLPMALVGGTLAAWLGGGVISLGSLVGFFTIFGIAARNAILLVNHCQHLEKNEGQKFGPALVIRGARERLSPILMTSLATGLALVPLIFLGDRPGHEIEYPLAIVIVGGLVTSTLLTLFVVPSLYLRLARPRAAVIGGNETGAIPGEGAPA